MRGDNGGGGCARSDGEATRGRRGGDDETETRTWTWYNVRGEARGAHLEESRIRGAFAAVHPVYRAKFWAGGVFRALELPPRSRKVSADCA
ncbi:hypothetical protein E2562_001205 [Oryza meyeriana var. granulata]|uniref:Uncharacterized protein n=1 Tax=Oryza meyeriana var. granulata TaxID=110450 RepID=A0A6G1DC25_9ORYZ|nr:hypothetical protein E2562_001205 [Oryza meyeriana var. granulata]